MIMIIRNFSNDDIKIIEKLWKDYQTENPEDTSTLPKLSNIVTCAIIEEEHKVIAYGMVKLFAELVLVLDPSASPKLKYIAMQRLLIEAIHGSRDMKLEQLHCFIQNEKFAEALKKHYAFEDCKGRALVLNI